MNHKKIPIKQFLKGLEYSTLNEYINKEYIEDGVAVINIALYDDFEIFDPLTAGKQLELNQDIYDLIDRKSNLIPASIPITVRFTGRNLTEAEQKIINNLIYEHYFVQTQDLAWDHRSNKHKMLGLLGFGIVLITVYFILALNFDNLVLLEILSIVGSFSVREAANCFIVERREIQKNLIFSHQLLNMNIIYEKNEVKIQYNS